MWLFFLANLDGEKGVKLLAEDVSQRTKLFQKKKKLFSREGARERKKRMDEKHLEREKNSGLSRAEAKTRAQTKTRCALGGGGRWGKVSWGKKSSERKNGERRH